mmetsp:Transcript_15699/g.54513  ORF Transcript_15699/g.54513 Transcript_15699/m.54513 type:complete len:621 (-) Transcript_15699:64-1926(-)|eukprot:CAMPEP_0203808482 /NCGR_PEP_ID=MMETSP0115-20131106/1651_1 /ASSEMBLY_ACC=CAM_ASM_000227 /TAXON_ID=33651 /ORGANISM="Bicosoecid sp, Strain ms1" /LENGTH=620 /DNA_ID=CAMNT_0050717171 /DNA_START=126 /DNA_END=1988 /DNA_ORIENTATION=-
MAVAPAAASMPADDGGGDDDGGPRTVIAVSPPAASPDAAPSPDGANPDGGDGEEGDGDLEGYMAAAAAKEDDELEGFMAAGARGTGSLSDLRAEAGGDDDGEGSLGDLMSGGGRGGAAVGGSRSDLSASRQGSGNLLTPQGSMERMALGPIKTRSFRQDGVDLTGQEDPVFRAMLKKVAAPANEEGEPDAKDGVEYTTVGGSGVVEDLEAKKKRAEEFMEEQRRERVEKMQRDEEEAKARAEAEARAEAIRRKKMEPCIPKKYWYYMEWWQHVEWESDIGDGWAPLCPGVSPRNSWFDRITCGLTTAWALTCFGAVITGAAFLNDDDHRCKQSSSLALMGLVWGAMCSITPLLIGCYMCMDRYQYHRYTLRAQRIIEQDEEEQKRLLEQQEEEELGDEEKGSRPGTPTSQGSGGRGSRKDLRGSVSKGSMRASRGQLRTSASRGSVGSRGSGSSPGAAGGWGASADAKVATSLMTKAQRKKVEAARKAEEAEARRVSELKRKRKMLPVIPEWYVELKYAIRGMSGWATLLYGIAVVPWIGVIIGLYKASGNERPVLNGARETCVELTDDGLCLGERECDHALYGYDMYWVIIYPFALIVFLWLYFKRTELMKRLKKPGGW